MPYCEGTGIVVTATGVVENIKDATTGSLMLMANRGPYIAYRMPLNTDGTCRAGTVLVDDSHTVFDQAVALEFFAFFFGAVIFCYYLGVVVGAVLRPLKNASRN